MALSTQGLTPRSGISLGEILGLAELLEEHWDAIDYDLLTLGLDIAELGTARLSWRRLRAVVTYLPSTSALARSMHGDAALWSTSDHLLASTVDLLAGGNWQRGGGKGKRPKPIPRPGAEDTAKSSTSMGTGRMSVDAAKKFFDRVNRGPSPPSLSGSTVLVTCADETCDRGDIHARGLCGMHYQRWRRANR